MRLFRIANLQIDEEKFKELDDATKSSAIELLISNAVLFYEAGGQLTLHDWWELCNTERAAFLIAVKKSVIDDMTAKNDVEEFNSLCAFVSQTAAKMQNKEVG